MILLLGCAGFLRVDELKSLRCKDISFQDDYMSVNIAKRKNEQYREGHTILIAKSGKTTCPVSVVCRDPVRKPWKTGSRFFAVPENVLTALGQTTCQTNATQEADVDIVKRNTTPPSATPPRRSQLANRGPTHQPPKAAVFLPPHSRVIQES